MCHGSLGVRDHSYGFSALSMNTHQSSLPAASCKGMTVFVLVHASMCSVLSTGHSSLLGPHTTMILSRPLFHWRFLCPLDLLGYLSPFLLHQTIWSRLYVFGLNLDPQHFLLRRRQLRSYQNLFYGYEYLIQLDKEKQTNKQINAIIQAFVQTAFRLLGMEPNECPAIANKRDLNPAIQWQWVTDHSNHLYSFLTPVLFLRSKRREERYTCLSTIFFFFNLR